MVHDVRTNALIITDTQENLLSAIDLLRDLDQRTREVQMEIKFVDFLTEDATKLGAQSAGLEIDINGLVPSVACLPIWANGGIFDNTIAYPGAGALLVDQLPLQRHRLWSVVTLRSRQLVS